MFTGGGDAPPTILGTPRYAPGLLLMLYMRWGWRGGCCTPSSVVLAWWFIRGPRHPASQTAPASPLHLFCNILLAFIVFKVIFSLLIFNKFSLHESGFRSMCLIFLKMSQQFSIFSSVDSTFYTNVLVNGKLLSKYLFLYTVFSKNLLL